jgi:hypothetical protein
VHRRTASPLRDPAAAAAAFGQAGQVAAEFGLRPWRVEAELGLGTAESLVQERSTKLVSARDLALDSGLLIQAGGAEVVLAEQAYVAEGPRALEAPAHRVLDLGAATQSAYLLALGDLLLAQSSALPGHERQMTAALASVEARGMTAPDTVAQLWAVRALPRLLSHDLPGALVLLDRFAYALVDHAPAAPLHQFGLWVLIRTILGQDDAEARTTLRQLPASSRRANRGALHYAEAIAEGRQGHRDRAEESFAAGEEDLSPVPYWQRLLRLLLPSAHSRTAGATRYRSSELILPPMSAMVTKPWPRSAATSCDAPAYPRGGDGVSPACRRSCAVWA